MSVPNATAANRRLATLLLASVLATGAATAANGYTAKVETACRDDYLRLCAAYPVGSAALRGCMESKAQSVSPRCANALVSTGIIDKRRLRR